MSRPRRPRLYGSLVAGIGVAVAGAAGLLLVLTLAALIGPFRFCAAPPPSPTDALRAERIAESEPSGAAASGLPPRIELAVEAAGPARRLLRVSNLGSQPARGVVVRVHLGVPAESVRVRPTLVGQALPELRFEPGDAQVDLVLPELPPRAHRAYALDIEGIPASGAAPVQAPPARLHSEVETGGGRRIAGGPQSGPREESPGSTGQGGR